MNRKRSFADAIVWVEKKLAEAPLVIKNVTFIYSSSSPPSSSSSSNTRLAILFLVPGRVMTSSS